MNRRDFLKYGTLTCIGAGIAGGAYRIFIKPKENKTGTLMETKDAKLFTLQFHLAEHCNLNCKYCCHFSCIAEEEFLDINKYEKDIKRLAELTDSKIYVINLLGGEPLLNENAAEYMKIARRYFPNSHLYFSTNGILLDKMNDEFWETIRDNYIELNISVYPIDLDIEKIKNKAEEFEITYMTNEWDTFDHLNLILDGSNNYVDAWNRCNTKNRCAFVYDGKYYSCYIPANIRHFNKKFNKNLEVCEKDYLDIYKVKSFDEFIDYSLTPLPFCRYCGDFPESVAWEQSVEHDISEWTYQIEQNT